VVTIRGAGLGGGSQNQRTETAATDRDYTIVIQKGVGRGTVVVTTGSRDADTLYRDRIHLHRGRWICQKVGNAGGAGPQMENQGNRLWGG